MIGYVTLGTNGLDRAAAFYDALLAELGATRTLETDRGIGWATTPGAPMLGVLTPENGEPATNGNGTMVALIAGSNENVDKLHAKAIELGATDEGAPGPRHGDYYGGYFRDLDGNKLVFFNT